MLPTGPPAILTAVPTRRRTAALTIVLLAPLGCGPRSNAVPPPKPAAPSTLVRGDEGLNKLANAICGQPCDSALEASASTLRSSASGMTHMELDTSACKVPGFYEEPSTCSAICRGDTPSVVTVLVDVGPIGPNTRRSLCTALERDRGAPTRGSCEDVCESGMGCAWPQSTDRAAVEFVGHLELQCPHASSDLDPNQSEASNSMSP